MELWSNFFFQAEDGIRDTSVTGVQTCALPIYIHNTANIAMVMKAGTLYDADSLDEIWPEKKAFGSYYWVNLDELKNDTRSEERRVGKESRTRWARDV